MIAFVMAAFLLIGFFESRAETEGDAKALYLASGVVGALAQGIWISFDCRHLGRRIRRWPLLGVFCGPIGIWIYMIVAYRNRALYMIPISIVVYAVAIALPELLFFWPEDTESALRP
ncbi:MAG TPA: hypothetical protein VFC86_07790 [Planctomycetota bacterium]|nr:hypothetical protein [Planctomycetota bacterium]